MTLNTKIDIQNPLLPEFLTASSPPHPGGDHLEAGEHVVALVAEEHREAHPDDHRQQQRRQHEPDPDALAAAEVGAGDAPELAPPRGEPGDEHQDGHRGRCRDRPNLDDPPQ
jgi:hypothetical protein